MKEYVIYIGGAFIFGLIIGVFLAYHVIKEINRCRKEKQYLDDNINNGS